jgi:hypothetical protein
MLFDRTVHVRWIAYLCLNLEQILYSHIQHVILNFSYHESSCAKLTQSGSENITGVFHICVQDWE